MVETILKLNTGTGQDTFTTGIITGELHGIILRSFNKIEIIIESELGYILFHDKEFVGTKYIALRQRSRAPTLMARDVPGFEKFVLNEALNITTIGPKNTEIDLIIRFN